MRPQLFGHRYRAAVRGDLVVFDTLNRGDERGVHPRLFPMLLSNIPADRMAEHKATLAARLQVAPDKVEIMPGTAKSVLANPTLGTDIAQSSSTAGFAILIGAINIRPGRFGLGAGGRAL